MAENFYIKLIQHELHLAMFNTNMTFQKGKDPVLIELVEELIAKANHDADKKMYKAFMEFVISEWNDYMDEDYFFPKDEIDALIKAKIVIDRLLSAWTIGLLHCTEQELDSLIQYVEFFCGNEEPWHLKFMVDFIKAMKASL